MSFQIDGHDSTIEPIFVFSAICRSIATEIFEMPVAARFSSPEELDAVFSERLLALPGAFSTPSGIDPAAAADLLESVVIAPPRHWTFRTVLFPPQFDVGFELKVGGLLPLRLTSERLAEDHEVLVLSGEVLAHTDVGAAAFVEQLVVTVIGAGIATGVLIHGRPPRPVSTFSVSINGTEHVFEAATQGILAGAGVEIPREVSDLERAMLLQRRIPEAMARHRRAFEKVLSAVGPRAEDLRNACRLACLAATTSDEVVALPLCFALLEGLLLDTAHGDNVMARLREALAHSIGADHDERMQLRGEIKRLYDLRSGFVHSVQPLRAAGARQRAVDLALRVLKREITLLESA